MYLCLLFLPLGLSLRFESTTFLLHWWHQKQVISIKQRSSFFRLIKGKMATAVKTNSCPILCFSCLLLLYNHIIVFFLLYPQCSFIIEFLHVINESREGRGSTELLRIRWVMWGYTQRQSDLWASEPLSLKHQTWRDAICPESCRRTDCTHDQYNQIQFSMCEHQRGQQLVPRGSQHL